jgi:hypothetical protein
MPHFTTTIHVLAAIREQYSDYPVNELADLPYGNHTVHFASIGSVGKQTFLYTPIIYLFL